MKSVCNPTLGTQDYNMKSVCNPTLGLKRNPGLQHLILHSKGTQDSNFIRISVTPENLLPQNKTFVKLL